MDVPADLKQPDQRSCGAASMVVAAGPPFDPATFGRTVLETHRRLTSWRLRGRLQLAWPRAIGTPPWALARELTALTGARHRTRVVRWRGVVRPEAGALFVGDRWLPRHVMLVLDDGRCYDPASGRVGPAMTSGRWRVAWLVVDPVTPAVPRSAPRSPA